MIHEIRNYHFEPVRMAEYREWAEQHAVPYLRRDLDVVGFWISTDEPPLTSGRPLDDLGSANVTWIIRWKDMAERHLQWERAFSSDEWAAIMEHHPGLEHYLRIESKFTEAVS